MSVIILKGTDRKLECTISQCEKINALKESRTDPKTPLNISGVVVELGDIKYAIKDSDTDKSLVKTERDEDNDKYYLALNEGYILSIKKRCEMKPEEKSKNTVLFETLFFGVTGKKINETQKEYIQKMQLEYFMKNQKHPFAKVDYFKLLKDLPSSRDDFNMQYHIGSASLRMIRRVIEEAFTTAHNMNYL